MKKMAPQELLNVITISQLYTTLSDVLHLVQACILDLWTYTLLYSASFNIGYICA
jgi:hypothetical protein